MNSRLQSQRSSDAIVAVERWRRPPSSSSVEQNRVSRASRSLRPALSCLLPLFFFALVSFFAALCVMCFREGKLCPCPSPICTPRPPIWLAPAARTQLQLPSSFASSFFVTVLHFASFNGILFYSVAPYVYLFANSICFCFFPSVILSLRHLLLRHPFFPLPSRLRSSFPHFDWLAFFFSLLFCFVRFYCPFFLLLCVSSLIILSY